MRSALLSVVDPTSSDDGSRKALGVRLRWSGICIPDKDTIPDGTAARHLQGTRDLRDITRDPPRSSEACSNESGVLATKSKSTTRHRGNTETTAFQEGREPLVVPELALLGPLDENRALALRGMINYIHDRT